MICSRASGKLYLTRGWGAEPKQLISLKADLYIVDKLTCIYYIYERPVRLFTDRCSGGSMFQSSSRVLLLLAALVVALTACGAAQNTPAATTPEAAASTSDTTAAPPEAAAQGEPLTIRV